MLLLTGFTSVKCSMGRAYNIIMDTMLLLTGFTSVKCSMGRAYNIIMD